MGIAGRVSNLWLALIMYNIFLKRWKPFWRKADVVCFSVICRASLVWINFYCITI